MNDFDVAIVGAGIIGHVTAFHLANTGKRVALIDPAPVSEASYAAAGMLAPIAEVQYQQQALYPLMVASAAEWPDLVSEVAAATGRTEEQLGYRHTETLVVGVDAADRQYLQDLAGVQREHNMDVEPIVPSAARRQEPALNPRLSAAIRIPTDHQIDPRIFLTQLQQIFTGESVPVTHIDATATKIGVDELGKTTVLVESAEGVTEVSAGHTVIANGLHAGKLLSTIEGLEDPQLPLRPVYGDILRVRVPEHLQPLLTSTVRAVVRGYPVYLVPRSDGTMVIGATSREDTLSGPSLGGVYELLRDAQEICPGVRETEIMEVIARARPGPPDDLPLLGQPHPNITVSTGYHRHGILLAALAGRITAALAAGHELTEQDSAYLNAMNPNRFSQAQGTPQQ